MGNKAIERILNGGAMSYVELSNERFLLLDAQDDLKRKIKQLGRDYGRASDTIRRLRGEVALLRQAAIKDARVQMWIESNRDLREELEAVRRENHRLRENLTMAYRERKASA